MQNLIKSIPQHINEGFYAKKYRKIEKPMVIHYFGMGGSGISGDLLQQYMKSISDVPVILTKDYSTPHVTRNSLLIFVSYSGNTEETIFNFKKFQNQRNIFVVSSNGELLSLAKQKNLEHYEVPKGLPPRTALGYIFSSIAKFLNDSEIINVENEIKETIVVLERNMRGYEKQGEKIAESLIKKIPIIYALSEKFYPVAYRFQCQLNENSKIFAHSHCFPEMNHNEIMGYLGFPEITKFFTILFLISGEDPLKNIKRKEIIKRIIKDIPFIEIKADGSTTITRFFSLIVQTDFVSYYLALKRNKDPFEIPLIEKLKKEL